MSDMSDMSTTCQDMGSRLLRGGGVTCPGIYCKCWTGSKTPTRVKRAGYDTPYMELIMPSP